MSRGETMTDEDGTPVGAATGLAGREAALAAIVVVAIDLVAIDLRPGIVSIGPVLPAIRAAFHLNHAAASLLTTIPALLMGRLALPLCAFGLGGGFTLGMTLPLWRCCARRRRVARWRRARRSCFWLRLGSWSERAGRVPSLYSALL